MDKKVSDYINKQKSPNKEVCLELRRIFIKLYPKIKEAMKWGAIVYDGGRYYVKYGVNLGLAAGGLNKEEAEQFEDNGKTMRHIKIEKLDDIDEKKIIGLIKLVHKKTVCHT